MKRLLPLLLVPLGCEADDGVAPSGGGGGFNGGNSNGNMKNGNGETHADGGSPSDVTVATLLTVTTCATDSLLDPTPPHCDPLETIEVSADGQKQMSTDSSGQIVLEVRSGVTVLKAVDPKGAYVTSQQTVTITESTDVVMPMITTAYRQALAATNLSPGLATEAMGVVWVGRAGAQASVVPLPGRGPLYDAGSSLLFSPTPPTKDAGVILILDLNGSSADITIEPQTSGEFASVALSLNTQPDTLTVAFVIPN